MTRARAALSLGVLWTLALFFVAGVVFGLTGCSQAIPREAVDAANVVTIGGTECMYALHKARVRACAEKPTEAEARACKAEADAAFDAQAKGIDAYRCAVGGACK